jgi:hypothetical protein
MPEQEDVADVMDVPETKEVPVEFAEEALEVVEVLDIADQLGSCYYFTRVLEIPCPAAASMELELYKPALSHAAIRLSYQF